MLQKMLVVALALCIAAGSLFGAAAWATPEDGEYCVPLCDLDCDDECL